MDDNILAYVFNNTDDAVCITHKSGVLQYVNPSAERLFEITPDSIGKDVLWEKIPLIKKNDSLLQLFLDAVNEQTKSQKAVVDFVNNEKKSFKLWVSITYTEENDGCFIIVINDVTQLFKVNAAFERYTSPDIADFVLNDPKGEKKGGQAKEITVLISDLRGFTAISSELAPSELIKALNHYFEKMVAVIERFGGTVIEFLGDGIFVVFGAPKDDPNHAAHAVACAIEMQNVNESDHDWYHQRDYPELEMGIGINSGSAVVGNIGSKQKMKYGVMGYTVNLAGRLESLTTGGQIFISEATKALLGDELQIISKNEVLLKGADKPIDVYDICGFGKHQLMKISGQNIRWRKLLPGSDFVFYLLDGKAVQKDARKGVLKAVSENQRYALFSADSPLKVSDNIMLSVGIDIYAKVVGVEEESYMISFTLRPYGFSEWIRTLRKRSLSQK